MKQQGLYDPAHEHDACGVGFVVDIKGRRSHVIVAKALQVLKNLGHRGASMQRDAVCEIRRQHVPTDRPNAA